MTIPVLLAQQLPKEVDQLQVLLESSATPKDSVEIMNELSWQLRYSNSVAAQEYADHAITLSLKLRDTVGIATGHNRLGTSLQNEGLYLDSALVHFNICYDLRMGLGDTLGALGAKNNIALIYTARHEYQEAIDIYTTILRMSERVGDQKRMARCKMNIGSVYNHTGDYRLALQYFWDSKETWEALGNTVEANKLNLNIANVYERIGQFDDALRLVRAYLRMCIDHGYLYGEALAYNNLGNILAKFKDYDSAMYYFHQSLLIKKQIRDFDGLATTYQNLANLYNTSHEDYDSALVYVQRTLDLHEQRGDSLSMARAYASLGDIQMNIGAHKDALESYLEALRLVEQYRAPVYLLGILRNISAAYEQLGDNKGALEYLHRFQVLQDTLSNQISQAYQQELELNKARHRTNVLDLQVRQRNMVIGGLVIGLVLTLALLIALLNASKQKRIRLQEEKKRMEAEQVGIKRKHEIEKLLKDQELKSIGQILEAQDQERRRIAQDLHDRLGSMLSMVKLHFQNTEESITKLHEYNKQEYERAIHLLDEACDEVRKISHNLISGVLKNFGLSAALKELQAALENIGKLEVDLVLHNMDERIGYDQEVNIYRIIQEAVNNILKHANSTYVSIQLVKTEVELRIMVEDNGAGFEKETLIDKKGIGLKNIESRVVKLAGEYQIDTAPGKGTTIIVTIPIN